MWTLSVFSFDPSFAGQGGGPGPAFAPRRASPTAMLRLISELSRAVRRCPRHLHAPCQPFDPLVRARRAAAAVLQAIRDVCCPSGARLVR